MKSPIVEESNLISFAILSDGKEIPGTYEVLEIRIEQRVNRIAEAEITLRDGSAANQTFDITDSDTFKPGAEIEIKLGYKNKNNSVFKGIITKQIIQVDDISGSKLNVICKDKALKLAINRKNAIFTDTKDSELIEQISNESGLSSYVESTTEQHKEIVQYYTTDWDFIISRAETNGLIVITDSGKLIVQAPQVSDSPALQVQYGHDIIEFSGELDATNQYSSVQGNAWDMSSQSVITAASSEPSVNEQGNITGLSLANVFSVGTKNLNSSVPITQSAIKTWANAALLKSRLSRFKGSVTFQGSANAKVNSTIKLMGLGERFNGNAFISGVTHTVVDGRWTTEAQIGLSAEWFVEKHPVSGPIASGLLPGVKGLQTGIVKKIYEDPDNEFRVQVAIPILGTEGESVWARLSTFYIGNGIGAYFMPEVNDEVILGFMNNDPRFPIILGSVYSSSIPAPETPDEDNSIKTLLTQSKLQLKFDDKNKVITILTPGGNTMVFSDEDKVITVLTPGGNSVVLSDEDKGITITDQNKNKVQMNDNGIVVESASDLTLKAAQNVKIEGMQIDVTGNQSATIKGSAQCEISSDGQMVVKGVTVAVN
jgi:Rhs element Vgr protein